MVKTRNLLPTRGMGIAHVPIAAQWLAGDAAELRWAWSENCKILGSAEMRRG
jgi:hypothetical protein